MQIKREDIEHYKNLKTAIKNAEHGTVLVIDDKTFIVVG